jgi:hypothetical protein
VNVCMPTFQNLMTVVVGTPTYAIYYFGFARPENINANPVTSYGIQQQSDASKQRFEVTVTAITWLSVSLAVSGSVWVLHIFGSLSTPVVSLTKFWGVTAAATNTVQWIPQINSTWNAQHEGVLSVSSLIISVFMDGLVAAFWIFGPRESLWICLSLTTDATLQILLIGMIFFFRVKRRRLCAEPYGLTESIISNPLLSPTDNSEILRDGETSADDATI